VLSQYRQSATAKHFDISRADCLRRPREAATTVSTGRADHCDLM
jgi:hypothetical protein